MLVSVTVRDEEESSTSYEILVHGHLGEQLVADLGARRFQIRPDRTLLVVEIIDQAHLRGVLEQLGDLNIEIERVNPV